MNTRNWIIGIVVVVIIIVIAVYLYRPGADMGATGTAPPTTTEQQDEPAQTN